MAKAPIKRSMAWSLLGAGSLAAIGYQAMSFFGYRIAPVDPAVLLQYAGIATASTVGICAAHDFISSLPWRRFRVVCENTGLYIHREAGLRLPRLRWKEPQPWGLRLWYKMPIGMAVGQFDEKRDRFETALDAEVSLAFRRGLLRVDILPGSIPDEPYLYEPAEGLQGELPFVVGIGREGIITADLAGCPHLLVAGQTGAGKSNMLHVIVQCLLRTDCILHIIDLKRVEFSYLEKHINVRATLRGSIDTLEVLTMEMERRMKFLAGEGHVNAKTWRNAHPDRKDELPFHVLIIDEFSQLCPNLAKEKVERDAKVYAHKMLVDLLSLARSLGIHVVLATQYPHHEILPGTLKQHLPVTIAFKVRDEVASRVCLGNDRAAKLPQPVEIPGRAVWQHDVEREVQTPHLPIGLARSLLAGGISLSPSPSFLRRFSNAAGEACPSPGFIDL